jgi:putative transposase
VLWHQLGLVHHSDRGVQYAADEYTGLLDPHDFQINMSRRGNPYDNARPPLINEDSEIRAVYPQEYRDLLDTLRSLRRFLEKVYNWKRLNSVLGYRPFWELKNRLSHRESARAGTWG